MAPQMVVPPGSSSVRRDAVRGKPHAPEDRCDREGRLPPGFAIDDAIDFGPAQTADVMHFDITAKPDLSLDPNPDQVRYEAQ
jgi:hypothetical protein